MLRAPACAAISALALLGALVSPTPSSAVPAASSPIAVAPAHTLAVTGPGVSLAPAYDPAIGRYAVRTTGAFTGSLTVSAGTDDPSGRVRVDGRPVSGGSTTLTGVEPGDEVSVIFDDAGGRAVHSLIVLPAAFPALNGTGPASGVAEGSLMLTMNSWNADPDRFHALVDDWGVPRWFRRMAMSSHDFRVQPSGSMTWSEPAPTREAANVIVEVDGRFREVARHKTIGLVNTDFHDSLLKSDGSMLLTAYEYDVPRIVTDSVFQEINPDGSVFHTWSTEDHVDRHAETVVDTDDPFARMDYSHLNAVTITPDGDYLASFRHLSSVFKIARTAHDGYAQGEIIWRLGGRLSDFEFVDDPYDGPCAQHTATMLPNGNVMVFDNGSMGSTQHPGFCVDSADPSGPTHARQVSRYVEWELDWDPELGAGTATMVRQYTGEDPGETDGAIFAPFTGSAFPLDNGNTLVGWGATGWAKPPGPAPSPIATELDGAGAKVWELTTPTRQGSYRVYREQVPDAFEPTVDLQVPAPGATYGYGEQVRADYGCTDVGGSSLQSCDGPTTSGALLPTTTPGTHTFEVVALDGDGNRTTQQRSYTVLSAPAPPAPPAPEPRADLAIKIGKDDWVGVGRYAPPSQAARALLELRGEVRGRLRLENTGTASQEFRIRARKGRFVHSSWYLQGKSQTPMIHRGRVHVRLEPGERVRLRFLIEATRRTEPGQRVPIRIVAKPRVGTETLDRVRLKLRVPGA
ncbi:aryl-sulfate sulfotransferase [Nocardioides bigeumensis]|uniref:Uncharacterized protein n=1 Tax=Nocardioides bigeumensis TaxID=433657 RepID=A0ABP5K1J2_9ACTN